MNQWIAHITFATLVFSVAEVGIPQESENADAALDTKLSSIDELLLFFPSKYPDGDWQPRGLRFVDVFFSAEDGTKLHGWYCPCENPRGVVLIAHGNAGHLASRAPWLQYLQTRMRLTSFIFDYRGYGRSEGTPTVQGAIKDAVAARGKLRELTSIRNQDMLLMGESLGGAIVIQLAADSASRGLILQSTFSSLRDVADVHFPQLSWLVPRNKLDSVTMIARYHGPLLQSHGNVDETIPLSLAERLFQAANEPKRFVTVEGADHNNWLTDSYQKELDEFVASVHLKNDSAPVAEQREWLSGRELVLILSAVVGFVLVLAILVQRKRRRTFDGP